MNHVYLLEVFKLNHLFRPVRPVGNHLLLSPDTGTVQLTVHCSMYNKEPSTLAIRQLKVHNTEQERNHLLLSTDSGTVHKTLLWGTIYSCNQTHARYTKEYSREPCSLTFRHSYHDIKLYTVEPFTVVTNHTVKNIMQYTGGQVQYTDEQEGTIYFCQQKPREDRQL